MSQWSPHVTVATIVERDGRYLLVEEHAGGACVLNQPAGHWEQGETLVEAAIRETLEETGWEVEPTHLIGIYEFEPEGLGYTFIRFAYLALPLKHHPERQLDDGIVRALWLSEAELAEQLGRHRSPMVAQCVADARRGQRYPLDFVQHLEPRPTSVGD
jgi:ADP-ribose pyrophosphatase YjhB (NUDIX family)